MHAAAPMPPSTTHYLEALPPRQRFAPGALVVADATLCALPHVSAWLAGFALTHCVEAGEALKQLDRFAREAPRMAAKLSGQAPAEIEIVALGGGSLGDFAGFFASVFKRGVRLCQLPSTWLAALDSAHGGKTALNLGGAKNQLGSFHVAERVFVVRELLFGQPEALAEAAMGELAKMALIEGGELWEQAARPDEPGPERLWRLLPQAVRAKVRVVARDPREQSGERRRLNLGHSLGHVIEAERGLAHGLAVGLGLYFAIELSADLGLLDEAEALAAELRRRFGLPPASRIKDDPLPLDALGALLGHDKKRDAGGHIDMLLLRGPGQVLRRSLPVEQVTDAARRLGWAR